MIAVNKIDRLKPGHIASQMQTAAVLGEFHALHPVSAKTGDGIRELRDELVGLLPEGPLYFPPEQRTDLSVETQIAELVREQALRLTKEEVPHAVSVEVEEIEEKLVRANLFVETESQKTILVGKGGAMVRRIGARRPAGDRAAPRPDDLPRPAGEGAHEVAARRGDARAPRPIIASSATEEGEVGPRFISNGMAFVTYSEGMNLVGANAQSRDPGACRRR